MHGRAVIVLVFRNKRAIISGALSLDIESLVIMSRGKYVLRQRRNVVFPLAATRDRKTLIHRIAFSRRSSRKTEEAGREWGRSSSPRERGSRATSIKYNISAINICPNNIYDKSALLSVRENCGVLIGSSFRRAKKNRGNGVSPLLARTKLRNIISEMVSPREEETVERRKGGRRENGVRDTVRESDVGGRSKENKRRLLTARAARLLNASNRYTCARTIRIRYLR